MLLWILIIIAWALTSLIYRYEVSLVKIYNNWNIRYVITKTTSEGEVYKITRLFKLF